MHAAGKLIDVNLGHVALTLLSILYMWIRKANEGLAAISEDESSTISVRQMAYGTGHTLLSECFLLASFFQSSCYCWSHDIRSCWSERETNILVCPLQLNDLVAWLNICRKSQATDKSCHYQYKNGFILVKGSSSTALPEWTVYFAKVCN